MKPESAEEVQWRRRHYIFASIFGQNLNRTNQAGASFSISEAFNQGLCICLPSRNFQAASTDFYFNEKNKLTGKYLFKTIAVGSGGVGKTSLICRFAEGIFLETYKPTLGVDFATKEAQLGDQIIKLVLFDTGSQELLGRLHLYYYRGANGALVCYDIAAKATFEALEGWFREVSLHVGAIPRLLVGTKADLAAHREVPRAHTEAYAQEKGLPYIETSAKTGLGVEQMYLSLARMMLEEVK